MNEKTKNPNKPMRINAYTPEDGKVSMHPSSVMATKMFGRNRQPICRNTGANWLVYWLKQKSTQLFLLDVTCVYTLPLLFFGDLNFTRGWYLMASIGFTYLTHAKLGDDFKLDDLTLFGTGVVGGIVAFTIDN